ncbi:MULTISPECIES: type IV pilus assembly protein PilM [Candidatus Ichthyocystis]|uniref:Putative type 4 fimbrial protein PilM n=1 Tax=Candidatus Ichthyocystis hellenicum TaxID=1561003 RepID=A0A0S4M2Y3_9BURK|nr:MULTISPECIES: type IV pilus assembly protein PilM [Ichthyocystis]CUT17340.1 putative type 4 fimbrial protein PilM [Candidatus Ichthyocystis hellenicum]
MEIFKKTLLGIFGAKASYTKALGIDMGSSSIKFAEVSSSGGRFILDSYHIEPLPDKSISMGNIAEHMLVVDAVKRGLSSKDFRAKSNVSIVMPDSMVTIREMSFFGNLATSLEMKAESEAVQVTGNSIDEIAVDFCVDKHPKDSGKINLLLAIAKQDQVDERAQVMRDAGVSPRILDIELYAFHSMCARFLDLNSSLKSKDKIYLFVEFGHSKMLFLFMRGHDVVFTKEQSFGASALNQEVQSELDTDFSSANRIIVGQDDAPEKYSERILPEFVSECCAVVYRTLQLFYTTTFFIKIDAMFISGGGSKLSGLSSAIEEEVGVEVKPLEAFPEDDISSSINRENFFSDLPRLTTAVGIAIRNLFHDAI